MTFGDRNEHTGAAQTASPSPDAMSVMAMCGDTLWTVLEQASAGELVAAVRWGDETPALECAQPMDVVVVDLTTGDPDELLASRLAAIRSTPGLEGAAVLAVIPGDVPGTAGRMVAGGADDVVVGPVDPDVLGLRLRRMQEAGAASAAVARLSLALDHSNRQLGRFAYTASHDLKEPLRAVTGFSRLLQTRHADALGESGLTYLEFITDGAKRMGDMIGSLLQFARVSQKDMEIERVDLGGIVGTILNRLRIEGLTAEISVGDLPTLQTDQELASVLLDALVDNAVKFAASDRPNVVSVQAQPADGGWQVSVSDTGVGIPVDGRMRMFDLFSRLHSREEYPGEGMGLGLANVIVQRLGGRIEVESDVDVGTTMVVTIGDADDEGDSAP